MANRYWVGGSGTWSASNTLNWSLSSGGAGGASVPTQFDVAVFDSLSGVDDLEITISGNVSYNSIDTSDRSGSLTTSFIGAGNMFRYGVSDTLSLVSTDFSGLTGYLNFASGTQFLQLGADSNCPKNIRILGGSTTYVFLLSGAVTITNFNVGLSGESLSAQCIISSAGLTLGSLNINGAGSMSIGSFDISVTVNLITEQGNDISGTGIITVSPSGSSSIVRINGLCPAIVLSPQENGTTFRAQGSGTIEGVSRDNLIYSMTIDVDTASDWAFGAWDISGQSGSIVTIQSSASGVRSSLRYTGAGTVETDYVEVKDMQPYPDNTWISFNSTDLGNNWQWYFDEIKKPVSNLFFGSHV